MDTLPFGLRRPHDEIESRRPGQVAPFRGLYDRDSQIHPAKTFQRSRQRFRWKRITDAHPSNLQAIPLDDGVRSGSQKRHSGAFGKTIQFNVSQGPIFGPGNEDLNANEFVRIRDQIRFVFFGFEARRRQDRQGKERIAGVGQDNGLPGRFFAARIHETHQPIEAAQLDTGTPAGLDLSMPLSHLNDRRQERGAAGRGLRRGKKTQQKQEFHASIVATRGILVLPLFNPSGTLKGMRILPFLLVLGMAIGCTGPTGQPGEEVLAKINGEPISTADFLVSFRQLKAQQDEISQKNPKLLAQLKTRALNEVLIIALLRQEAAKKQLRIAKEEVEGRLSNWKDGYPPGGFEEMLRKQNTTEDFLKKRIADQLLVEKLTETLFGMETMVNDEEMQTYYKQHQEEFFRPVRIHALQIVVPTLEEAEKIRQEIVSGQITFESAARKYSLSPDAAKGGDLGFFSKNEKISAFNKAFALTVGDISGPIQSPYGIHLLKVVEKQPPKKLAFNEAKDDIVKALKKLKEVTVYKEWITKLLKDGEIYRNDVLFATLS